MSCNNTGFRTLEDVARPHIPSDGRPLRLPRPPFQHFFWTNWKPLLWPPIKSLFLIHQTTTTYCHHCIFLRECPSASCWERPYCLPTPSGLMTDYYCLFTDKRGALDSFHIDLVPASMGSSLSREGWAGLVLEKGRRKWAKKKKKVQLLGNAGTLRLNVLEWIPPTYSIDQLWHWFFNGQQCIVERHRNRIKWLASQPSKTGYKHLCNTYKKSHTLSQVWLRELGRSSGSLGNRVKRLNVGFDCCRGWKCDMVHTFIYSQSAADDKAPLRNNP